MKTREDIITECAAAVAACWNHYVDSNIEPDAVDKIKVLLDQTLPRLISTKQWNAYAKAYNKRVAKENQLALKPIFTEEN